jgi:hypothetical protein
MDMHTKNILWGIVRGNVVKAEADFIKKVKELNDQKHQEFEKFRKKVGESVKDIPEDDFASFATACLGTMSNELNSLMIAGYVSEHENMSQVRKIEFLLMAKVSSGMIDADELAKKMFPDGFDE